MNKIQQKTRIINSGMKGQNYWFNGCMEYLMECLGETKDYDYWFFSGITGDSFTQIYCKNIRDMVFCYSDGFLPEIIKNAFDFCGYNFEYFNNLLGKDHKPYDNMIKAYIDKGIPVIARVKNKNIVGTNFSCIYGYDENKFYAISGEVTEDVIYPDQYFELIFIKEAKDKPNLANVYRNTVMNIPLMINLPETEKYAFGKKAFLYWADSFQNGTFDNIPVDENSIWYTHAEGFSCWNMHGNYLCMLGTNNCSVGFLERALHFNPDMGFINDLNPLFNKMTHDGFGKLIGMAGGFELKPKDIKNKNLMKPITDEIYNIAKYNDEILDIFNRINKERANCT